VLGKITWPNACDLSVNFTMAHVQGEGEQQFGFRQMKAYEWYDWRFFYSSNVSVKKNIVTDWMIDGFDIGFPLAAFEDAEFGLRATRNFARIGKEFRIFYMPAAQVVHHHPYTVGSFLRRQVACGMMAQRLLDRFPEQAKDLGLDELIVRLQQPEDRDEFPIEHYMSVLEGIKSWALIIEHHYGLGTQNWHSDLLRAVFRLAFCEGFLRVQTNPDLNIASGCRYVLETVRAALNRAVVTEVVGTVPGFGLI
jgi:hypothetical protein